jgi:putative transposase
MRRMANENPSWGAPRIHGELLKLGFEVSERSISRNLRCLSPPDGARERWSAFLRNHREAITAMDFFTVPTLTFRVLYCFFVIEHGRRKILHFDVTEHPTGPWIVQQLREAFPESCPYGYTILDGDAKYGKEVTELLAAGGIKPTRISPASPWQNGIAERWIGSCRREFLDHVSVLNDVHLRRLMRDYISYYYIDRIQDSLEKDTPSMRPISSRSHQSARLISFPRVGGLHHRYDWQQAA